MIVFAANTGYATWKAARLGGAYGQRRLDVRRHGERHRVTGGEQRVDARLVRIRLGVMGVGEFGRCLAAPGPDAAQYDTGVRGEGGGVGHAGPGAGADKAYT